MKIKILKDMQPYLQNLCILFNPNTISNKKYLNNIISMH